MAGIHAGTGAHWLQTTEGSSSARPAFRLGLIFNVASSELFSLQPELNYMYRPSQISIQNPTDSASSLQLNVRAHYVEVPLLFQFWRGYKVRYFGEAGPSMSFLLKGTEKGEIFDPTTNLPLAVDAEADYREHSIGFALGGGVVLDNLLLGLRYQVGLTDVERSSNSRKSNSLALRAGYVLFF